MRHFWVSPLLQDNFLLIINGILCIKIEYIPNKYALGPHHVVLVADTYRFFSPILINWLVICHLGNHVIGPVSVK